MQIPQADLRAQYQTIKAEIDQAILETVESTQFIRGPRVKRFEDSFAAYCQTEFAIGVANGTDALWLALRAMEIGPGDEIITVPFTFAATTEAIHWVGAKIVFVDVDPGTYTIDVEQIERRITDRTRAIIPVHLYGHPADMDPILDLAGTYDLRVLEDSAQAHGACYRGRRVGSMGHAATFSFYPGKNLGAYGDAGAVVTNDSEIAQKIRYLGDHGSSSKYQHKILGFNSRLDALQAAVLQVKLKYLDDWSKRRREIAAFYDRALQDVRGIRVPKAASWAEAVYHLYVIEVENRDLVKQKLNEAGIGAGIHYPVALHRQPAFDFLDIPQGSFPASERAAERVLSLPNYPEMTEEMLDAVVAKVKLLIAAQN